VPALGQGRRGEQTAVALRVILKLVTQKWTSKDHGRHSENRNRVQGKGRDDL
jgi:hypothetical protein